MCCWRWAINRRWPSRMQCSTNAPRRRACWRSAVASRGICTMRWCSRSTAWCSFPKRGGVWWARTSRRCWNPILGSWGLTAQQALKEMRLLLFDLRPLTLEEEGLVGALQQRLNAVEKRAGLQASIDAEETLSLPPLIEESLYRIAQEALNNSAQALVRLSHSRGAARHNRLGAPRRLGAGREPARCQSAAALPVCRRDAAGNRVSKR